MSIKLAKILTILGEIGVGSLVGVVGRYLISNKSSSRKLSKKQLDIGIDELFSNLCRLIDESSVKNLFKEIKYTLPNEISKSYKSPEEFREGCVEWFDFWKNKTSDRDLSFYVDFRSNIKENVNLASYDIVCKHDSKKYKFSMIFRKINKANYETAILWMIENIDPLIKKIDEILINYSL